MLCEGTLLVMQVPEGLAPRMVDLPGELNDDKLLATVGIYFTSPLEFSDLSWSAKLPRFLVNAFPIAFVTIFEFLTIVINFS